MKRWMRSLLAVWILFWAVLPAGPAEGRSDPAAGNAGVEVKRIPWRPAEKVEGLITVTFPGEMQQPVVKARGSAVRVDTPTGHIIPAQNITLTRWPAGGAGATGQSVVAGQMVSFAVTVDAIPAPGVYKADLVATSADGGTSVALPVLTIKALPDVQVTLPDGTDRLVAQWTNLEAPAWFPFRSWTNRWLPLEEKRFVWTYNPPVALEVTMPGGERAEVAVKIDPPVNANKEEAVQVRFWSFPRETIPAGSIVIGKDAQPSTVQGEQSKVANRFDTLKLTLVNNDVHYVGVFRQYGTLLAEQQAGEPGAEQSWFRKWWPFGKRAVTAEPDAGNNALDQASKPSVASVRRLTAERIRPGIYKTKIHVISPWGTEQTFPVEIHVRDGALWPALAVILGILLSVVANHWLSRKDLLRAYMLLRRWRMLYQLSLKPGEDQLVEAVEKVLARAQSAILDMDGKEALQLAGLLKDMVRHLDRTRAMDAHVYDLLGMTGTDSLQVWAAVTQAADLQTALKNLNDYCEKHTADRIKEMAHKFDPLTAPDKQMRTAGRTDFNLPFWSGLAGVLRNLFSLRRLRNMHLSPATPIPAIRWRTLVSASLAYVVLFLFVGASVVFLQLSQAYYPNTSFGSASDYLNLIFWGFAGDTTRTKVMDLARGIMPGMPQQQAAQTTGQTSARA